MQFYVISRGVDSILLPSRAMRKSDFFYDLPDDLIARYPLPERTDSRLLAVTERGLQDCTFHELPTFLNPGDLLVLNDTRVIPARLFGRKPTGGQVEILIERITGESTALVLMRSSKTPKPGSRILLDGDRQCTLVDREGDLFLLDFSPLHVLDVLDAIGHVPLPPYIDRADEASDFERYQTVFSEQPGAVAAPTAGLHFDRNMLEELRAHGVDQVSLTLHVGSGTFQPVRVENLDEHVMHQEWLSVPQSVVDRIRLAQEQGGRIVAVGTTVVRALETAAQSGTLQPYEGDTQLFIRPGYSFKVVDAMVTNFHLPESTLLMLVCAFAGYQPLMAAYQHAIALKYRFFSYGDAMFLTRNRNA